MATKLFPLKTVLFLSKVLRRSKSSNASAMANQQEFLKKSILRNTREQDPTLVFHLESALLKSGSLFPYFMLVAFEAGGLLRSLILLLLYPLVLLLKKHQGMKVFVFVSFVGIKKEKLRTGSAILPKFFLEDVGSQAFDFVMSYKRKVAVTDLPEVMVEGFLRDYLGVEAVVGRELKVFRGYFLGLMEEKKEVDAILKNEQSVAIGFFGNTTCHQFLSHCKEIYLVTKAEKKNWQNLPRNKYPKPLIFHDGRLAFKPTPVSALVMFLWLPFGFLLNVIRTISFLTLPFKVSCPILAITGMRTTISKPKSLVTSGTRNRVREGGVLFVCNHTTLLDPLYISLGLMQCVSAVTYSLSRFSELIAPIKTVRLTRDREQDGKMMERMLKQNDLVVCPEGTTCREPYLLRFSPLFAELSDEIVPVAIDIEVSMFYGSTASGLKCLDPTFHLMNPNPIASIKILDKLPSSETCMGGGKSKVEVANYVQKKIANALGFECTNLTRRDKYRVLAGNEGIV